MKLSEFTPINKEKNKNFETSTKDQNLFWQDVSYRLTAMHSKMNYHYLMYKGIMALNQKYGAEYIKSLGLQVNVPRTFMTIEAIRSEMMGRTINIDAVPTSPSKKSHSQSNAARTVLRGEFTRSKSQNALSDIEYNALLFGTGFGLLRYTEDAVPISEEQKKKHPYISGLLERYKGIKLQELNPYHVFPDHRAKTSEPGLPGTWKHCFVYSMWDFNEWKKVCETNGYDTEGMEKGGMLQEFDMVRRQIDAIYSIQLQNVQTRQDSGEIVTQQTIVPSIDTTNMIMVVEKFTDAEYTIYSGANWTINHKASNTFIDQRIPVYPFKDYHIPDEFDGIGEPEVLRWQQYEENRIHNLAYMQVLMSTVKRYGVIEEMMKDPTEARMADPFKPIRMKNIPGADINKALRVLDQGATGAYPQQFLQEVKNIGQSATGITDFVIGGNKALTDTATEANKLAEAASTRIRSKIIQMENRDLVPVLEQWLINIPILYSDEVEYLVQEDQDTHVIFLPYEREMNEDLAVVQDVIEKTGGTGVTVEDVYKSVGYHEVVFITDILNRVNISIAPVLGSMERENIIRQLREIAKDMILANAESIKAGQQPRLKVDQLFEDLLTQFPDVIKDPKQYIYEPNEGNAGESPATVGGSQGGDTGIPGGAATGA